MTWWRGEKHYEVFFNRDELKTRSRAFPPECKMTENKTCYLSPTDPDAGGTWMLVNEHGVTICLLNRWHEMDSGPSKGKPQSRGQLVLSLAHTTSAQDAVERLQKTDCSQYKPFTLVALDLLEVKVIAWDGENLFREEAEPPLTSSSYCFQRVKKARRDRYEALPDTSPASLRAYHEGENEASAFTVRMNRPDAQTWSRSHLRVSPTCITWEYLEEMPNLAGGSIPHHSQLPLS